MFAQIRLAPALVIVAFAFANADDAAGALLLPDLSSSLSSESSIGATGGSRDATPAQPINPEPTSPEVVNVWASPASTTSTGAPAVVFGSPTVATALPSVGVGLDGGLLVEYLQRESWLSVPVPFLEGVFRPPRQIG